MTFVFRTLTTEYFTHENGDDLSHRVHFGAHSYSCYSFMTKVNVGSKQNRSSKKYFERRVSLEKRPSTPKMGHGMQLAEALVTIVQKNARIRPDSNHFVQRCIERGIGKSEVEGLRRRGILSAIENYHETGFLGGFHERYCLQHTTLEGRLLEGVFVIAEDALVGITIYFKN